MLSVSVAVVVFGGEVAQLAVDAAAPVVAAVAALQAAGAHRAPPAPAAQPPAPARCATEARVAFPNARHIHFKVDDAIYRFIK